MRQFRFTPEKISELKDGEIFVFGSNEAGIHGAGAARLAFKEFGAVWGKGFGHEGRTFAIPTKDENIKTLPLSIIERYVGKFLDYADVNQDFTFLVTEIGCGLAGYKPQNIAPFFSGYPLNVVLPESFVKALRDNFIL